VKKTLCCIFVIRKTGKKKAREKEFATINKVLIYSLRTPKEAG